MHQGVLHTVRDLIEASMREIGVLAASETAPAQDAYDALARLGMLQDRLKTEKLTLYTVTRATWPIVSGTGAYFIGPGGTPSVLGSPIHIQDVRFQDTSTDPDTEYPMTRLTEEAWAGIAQKGLTNPQPQAYYWNPTYAFGTGWQTLTLWPIPTATTLLGVLYYWKTILRNTTLEETLDLPHGYLEMLVTNLAVMLCPMYGIQQPNPMLMRAATESMAAIKRANKRLTDMSFEPAALIQGRGRFYDVFEG